MGVILAQQLEARLLRLNPLRYKWQALCLLKIHVFLFRSWLIEQRR